MLTWYVGCAEKSSNRLEVMLRKVSASGKNVGKSMLRRRGQSPPTAVPAGLGQDRGSSGTMIQQVDTYTQRRDTYTQKRSASTLSTDSCMTAGQDELDSYMQRRDAYAQHRSASIRSTESLDPDPYGRTRPGWARSVSVLSNDSSPEKPIGPSDSATLADDVILAVDPEDPKPESRNARWRAFALRSKGGGQGSSRSIDPNVRPWLQPCGGIPCGS